MNKFIKLIYNDAFYKKNGFKESCYMYMSLQTKQETQTPMTSSSMTTNKPTRPMDYRCRLRAVIYYARSKWSRYTDYERTTLPRGLDEMFLLQRTGVIVR